MPRLAGQRVEALVPERERAELVQRQRVEHRQDVVPVEALLLEILAEQRPQLRDHESLRRSAVEALEELLGRVERSAELAHAAGAEYAAEVCPVDAVVLAVAVEQRPELRDEHRPRARLQEALGLLGGLVDVPRRVERLEALPHVLPVQALRQAHGLERVGLRDGEELPSAPLAGRELRDARRVPEAPQRVGGGEVREARRAELCGEDRAAARPAALEELVREALGLRERRRVEEQQRRLRGRPLDAALGAGRLHRRPSVLSEHAHRRGAAAGPEVSQEAVWVL